MRKYGSPARIRTPISCIQGRRDNHYTTGEPTVTADEIAQLILITSLRSLLSLFHKVLPWVFIIGSGM